MLCDKFLKVLYIDDIFHILIEVKKTFYSKYYLIKLSDKLCINIPLNYVNFYSLPDKLPPTFSSFKSASFDEIKQLIISSPKSTCQSDPISSNLLPHCIEYIVLVITCNVNLSFNTGSFLKKFKSAFVKPFFF